MPKLLPWLFFPDANATIYMDAENRLGRPHGQCPTAAEVHATAEAERWAVWDDPSAAAACRLEELAGECGGNAPCLVRPKDSEAKQLSLREMASSVLGDCGASFAAMAHWARHTKVMDEFEAIRLSKNTEEPDELAKQEAAYRADAEYMKAVDTGRARMIDGELLVRSNDEAARQLGSAWMRAYLRGADRDQPAFAYAFFKAVIEPCTLTGGDCNVACGGGKVNLLQHASRGGCGTESEKGWWGTAPAWVCSCDGPGCYACLDTGCSSRAIRSSFVRAVALDAATAGRAEVSIDALNACQPPCHVDGTEGLHVVLIGMSNFPSSHMRGSMVMSVLQQMPTAHDARISMYDLHNDTAGPIADHFARHGFPSVCIFIKSPSTEVEDECAKRRALLLLDCVDDPNCASEEALRTPTYRRYHALLVQTRALVRFVEDQGLRAVRWVHSHGNLKGWSIAQRASTPRVRNVGFVVGDPVHNGLGADVLEALARGCCAEGARLWVVASQAPGPTCPGCPAVINRTSVLDDAAQQRCEESVRAVDGQQAEDTIDCDFAGDAGSAAPGLWEQSWGAMSDEVAQQRAFYDSDERLLDIDVGLLWPPTDRANEAGESEFSVQNRPPTRMAWWLSHRIPVIGYPMEAYVELAQEVGYPAALLNLTSAEAVRGALRRIASPRTRGCLQTAGWRAAELLSPQQSALQLLQLLPATAERAGVTLPRLAPA